MGLSESFLMILLSSLLFLLPSLLCGPKYSAGNLDVDIDQGMIDVSISSLIVQNLLNYF